MFDAIFCAASVEQEYLEALQCINAQSQVEGFPIDIPLQYAVVAVSPCDHH